jgi:hypothetical protein
LFHGFIIPNAFCASLVLVFSFGLRSDTGLNRRNGLHPIEHTDDGFYFNFRGVGTLGHAAQFLDFFFDVSNGAGTRALNGISSRNPGRLQCLPLGLGQDELVSGQERVTNSALVSRYWRAELLVADLYSAAIKEQQNRHHV